MKMYFFLCSVFLLLLISTTKPSSAQTVGDSIMVGYINGDLVEVWEAPGYLFGTPHKLKKDRKLFFITYGYTSLYTIVNIDGKYIPGWVNPLDVYDLRKVDYTDSVEVRNLNDFLRTININSEIVAERAAKKAKKERDAAVKLAKKERDELKWNIEYWYTLNPGLNKKFKQGVLDGEIMIGMDIHLVRLSWGSPKRKSETVTISGTTETWAYEKDYSTYVLSFVHDFLIGWTKY